MNHPHDAAEAPNASLRAAPARRLLARAVAASESEDFDAAFELATRILESDIADISADAAPGVDRPEGAAAPDLPAAACLLAAEAELALGDCAGALARIADAEARGWLRPGLLRAEFVRGLVLLDVGRVKEAHELARDRLRGMARDVDLRTRARWTALRGISLGRLGKSARARRHLRDAVALARVAGDTLVQGRILYCLAREQYRSGSLDDARGNLRLARAAVGSRACPRLQRRIEALELRVMVASGRGRGRLRTRDDEPSGSRVAIEKLEKLAAEGDEALANDDCGLARRSFERAAALVGSVPLDAEIRAGLLRREGLLLLVEGNARRAGGLFHKAIEEADRGGWRLEKALARMSLGRAHAVLGCFEKSCRDFAAAADMLAAHGALGHLAGCRREEAATWLLRRRTRLRFADRDDALGGLQGDESKGIDELEQSSSAVLEALRLFISLEDADGEADCREIERELRRERREEWLAAGSSGRAAESGARLRPGTPCVTESPRMARALEHAAMAAENAEPVLIVGETGTGKELIARHIHDSAPRREGPFVAVNCSAVPEALFEREFFGHSKGAYTGADSAAPGFCERAEGGTLFLDEIGDMEIAQQAKLLRLIQEGTYQRLGDPVERSADLRIVAATNADLERRMDEGRFRRDLFYRLQVMVVEVPPLRERGEDIPPLIAQFVQAVREEGVAAADIFTDEALSAMRRYRWPGNVRELEGVVRRLTILSRRSGRITAGMLPAEISGSLAAKPAGRDGMDLGVQMNKAERACIERALVVGDGNRSEASRLLGISRNSLYKKMQKHGIR